MIYNPQDWYWKVGSDQANVYSSSRSASVPIADSQYQAFLANGGGATPISSMADLAAVFAEQYPGGMLLTYANALQWQKAMGGYPTTVGEEEITFPTTSESLSLISGKVQRLEQPEPPTTITWQLGPNQWVDIPADQFKTLATQIADFVQGTFDTLRTVLADIGSGQLTTREQVYTAIMG